MYTKSLSDLAHEFHPKIQEFCNYFHDSFVWDYVNELENRLQAKEINQYSNAAPPCHDCNTEGFLCGDCIRYDECLELEDWGYKTDVCKENYRKNLKKFLKNDLDGLLKTFDKCDGPDGYNCISCPYAGYQLDGDETICLLILKDHIVSLIRNMAEMITEGNQKE